MSTAALKTLRPVIFSGIEKLSFTSRFSASDGHAGDAAGAERCAVVLEDACDDLSVDDIGLGSRLRCRRCWWTLMEFGNCARLFGDRVQPYWPIMAQEPSADTLTRARGLGTATIPIA